MNKRKLQNAVKTILKEIGENPERQGLRKTPERIARMYEKIFAGISKDPRKELKVFFEKKGYNEIILAKDIPFYSICEHHLLPFFGKVDIAYIPKNGRITGLSKLIRVTEILAQRPQIQERLTEEIADVLLEVLQPQGTLVIIEAEHLCMSMRGVKKPGTKIVTSAMRGVFLKDLRTRSEAISLIKQ